jgi:hypothetical protein
MDLITRLAENAEENIKDAVGAVTGVSTDSEPAKTESFYVRKSHINSWGSPVPNDVYKSSNIKRWYRPAYYYPWYYPTYSYPYYMPYYSSYPSFTVKNCPDCKTVKNITLELPKATNILLISLALLLGLMMYKK